MNFDVSVPAIRRLGLLGWGIVVSLGLASECAYHLLGHPVATRLLPFFSLSFERNLPTWYSSSLLLVCALLLTVIACERARSGARFVKHWWLLAFVFAYVSLDEAVSIHENWGGWTQAGGIFYFDWVIPGSLLVVAFVVTFLPFLRGLPAGTRDAFLLCGALYVGGALGVEFFLGYWTDLHGDANLGYALIDFVEESLEILGVTLFVPVLLGILADPAGHLDAGRLDPLRAAERPAAHDVSFCRSTARGVSGASSRAPGVTIPRTEPSTK